jgi:hypothetical protein
MKAVKDDPALHGRSRDGVLCRATPNPGGQSSPPGRRGFFLKVFSRSLYVALAKLPINVTKSFCSKQCTNPRSLLQRRFF